MFGFESRRSLFLYTAFIVILAVVVSVGVVTFYGNGGNLPVALANNEQPAVTAEKASLTPPGLNPDTIADMVEASGPAVVLIETTSKINHPNVSSPFFNDPFFRQFFGYDFEPQPRVATGLGSGFIISKDGYILTNEHVIAGATDIQVQVTGYKESFPAKVIGKDFDLDLAVLKIESKKDLPTLKLGDSDKVKVGNWVVAIGNPLGLDHTVTVGVISAKGRPIAVEDRQYKNLLQTDASINPGNSGGPLLNLQGEVIGINTAVNASAQGIGFAIPSSTVQEVLQDLMNKGKVSRPWIGVYLQPVTKELADYFGLPKEEGAVVTSVIPGSPADKAGLKRGDVILEFNKKQIKTTTDLQEAVQQVKIGQKVVALIWRDKKTSYVTLTITEKQDMQP
ncbi:trypsin-like peptidase domain-containing protein [Zhaonella formicivorans]|jgi:Do/DeqQ family serine protease|uniref:trypsin-like peptidase domain-containing protein n=1 Tax=Zhaonella formicivorans TaxID=2528593 RepID=UPI0010E9A3EA|nr:trypsin-like peptidase domain-containing protein [Zhaonella formicivorans]